MWTADPVTCHAEYLLEGNATISGILMDAQSGQRSLGEDVHQYIKNIYIYVCAIPEENVEHFRNKSDVNNYSREGGGEVEMFCDRPPLNALQIYMP